jgi:hypothetical protein
MSSRREFLTLLGGAAAWPGAARAQQASRLVRIGFLSGGVGPNPNVYGFQHGLRQLGYVEGQNFVLIYRWAGAQRAPIVDLARDSVPGFAVTGWLGIGAPKGTPAEIVERLNQEVNLALADPAVKARMADLGSEPLFGSVSDFAKLIADETEKWAKVVRFAGLKPE